MTSNIFLKASQSPFRQKLTNIAHYLTDTSTYNKTFLLSLLYVFLFYFPFTFMTLILNKVVFFQLDYVYQFSTIVYDFRNKLFHGDFSTWDFKNGIGYDYFANFYYFPLDISLLPFFLFPFLSYSQLMWLSFVFKVLLGTAAISYLLRLYNLSNKTNLLISVLYGTADLFFAQNVFPSYTGLIYYIPLILIAIELIIQKNNYFIFSLVIFQIFLFNSYWAWGLSLFMAFSLLFRCLYHFFTTMNTQDDEVQHSSIYLFIKNVVFILIKSVFFYLIGLGMAGFFFFPTFLGIMSNEPRMELSQRKIWEIFFDVFKTLKYKHPNMVYYKEIFKMLVPNLYMYSGFFHDLKAEYWLTTNHMIIYSSILSTFSIFFIIFCPTALVKSKLEKGQIRTLITLKIVNLIAILMLIYPFTAYLFSLNSGPYMRWLVFFGVLLIIDFAFVYEYGLFNKTLFTSFLIVAIGYLIFSIQFNHKFVSEYESKYGDPPNIFTSIDESVAYTMIIVFIIIILMIILLDKYFKVQFVLLLERFVGIGLIFAICTSAHFTEGVRHADVYGRDINRFMKKQEFPEYYTMLEFLFFSDHGSEETMQDMPYLFDFPVYNNFNIFHSLVNPYYTYYNTGHTRYFRAFDVPYLYYYYMDPSLFILSDSKISGILNGMYDPDSELIYQKEYPEFNSFLSIYRKEPQFSIGNGFTTYSLVSTSNDFDFLWLQSFYVKDSNLIKKLSESGFTPETTINRSKIINYIYYDRDLVRDHKQEVYFFGNYKVYPINVTRDEAEAVLVSYKEKVMFSVDNDGVIRRCFSTFCIVPENGLKEIIISENTVSPVFFTIKKSYLEERTEFIKKYSTYDVEIKGNTVKAKVDNDIPLIMTFKIGYAPGWKAYVDGKEVEVFSSYNGQLSFLLMNAGTHDIVLKYETPYLKQGLKVTGYSTLLFAGVLFLHYLKRGLK